MSALEEKVILKIRTHDGNIEIPFISLESLDEFTVRYENRDELLNSLFSMLDIHVDKVRVIDVYVYYEYVKNEKIRDKTTRVKYSKNNFNKKRVVDYLKEFLNRNHEMIKYCGVRKIGTSGIRDYLDGYRDIEKYEIEDAVDKYFDKAPYGVYRKNYFFLIDNGVNPTINRVNRKDKTTISREISKFHSDDEYIQSILRSAQSDEDFDKIYEELSKIELEELKKLLTNPHFGLFDGDGNNKPYTLEDLYDLEQCTGMDIDNLCDYVSRFKKGPKR